MMTGLYPERGGGGGEGGGERGGGGGSHTSDICHVVMHSVCSKLSVYNITQETALYWDDTRTAFPELPT